MRVKHTPYKALPFGVAVWEALLKKSESLSGLQSTAVNLPNNKSVANQKSGSASQNATAYSSGNVSPLKAKETNKTLKRELSQLFHDVKPKGYSTSTSSGKMVEDQAREAENGAQQDGRKKRKWERREADEEMEVEFDLTDLQKQILRVIAENGGSVSFSIIYEEIQKLWNKLRKRDGSKYGNELRRTISSTLANPHNGAALFEKDITSESGEVYWKFGPKVSSLNLDFDAIKRAVEDTQDNSVNRNDEEGQSVPKRRKSSDRSIVEQAEEVESKRPTRKHRREENIEQESQSPVSRQPFLARMKRRHAPSEHETSELEKAILEAINSHNGSASLDQIVAHVSKSWNSIRKKDGSTFADCRKAVKSTLLYNFCSSEVGFESDPKREGYWRIITPSTKPTEEEENRSKSSSEVEEEKEQEEKQDEEEEQEEETQDGEETEEQEGETQDGEEETEEEEEEQVAKKRKPLRESITKRSVAGTKLTEMHEVLIRIVLSHGGVCSFEDIFDDVVELKAKNHRGVRQLGSDVKRALLASLSHNPPGNFVKTKEGLWTIAPKALGIAKQLVEENEDLSMEKIEKLTL